MGKFVYVAGPMSSSGNYTENIRLGIEAGEKIIAAGGKPFVPQLSALWQLISPHNEYSFWLPYDLAWLEKCDALFRIPGKSKGADKEEAYARKLGIPVFYKMTELVKWLNGEV